MSRRSAAPKRVILPDPLFHSELVAKFINSIMSRGKKSVSESIVYDALEQVAKQATGKASEGEETSKSADAKNSGIRDSEAARTRALKALEEAFEKVGPRVEVRSRRVGGATYQVPTEVRAKRRLALAMRWIKEAARKRGGKSMAIKLANEILDAREDRGAAIKKREDTHRMADANKAFAHYRW